MCGSIGFWAERTEVHKAAYQGQVSVLQSLIQSGASVNIVAVDSITPLHEAAARGQTQCVRLLLDAGAQVPGMHIQFLKKVWDWETHGSIQLSGGSTYNTKYCHLKGSLLSGVVLQVDARNVDGSTPLCEACSIGNFECVRLLLEYGAKINPTLTSRTTSPLHEACMGGVVVWCEL